MFFSFIGKYWLVLLITLIVYVAIMFRVVLAAARELPGLKLKPRYYWRWPKLFFLIGLVISPVLFLLLRAHRRRMAEELAQEEREMRVREQRAAELRKAESVLRERREAEFKRREWLAANPPVLYYNTVNGITAVVVPADYDAAVVETKREMRDGKWTCENVLVQIAETFIFVNVAGEAAVTSALVASGVRRASSAKGYYTGWLSDLDDLEKKHNITLVHKENIFVPFVNETLLPFDQHHVTTSRALNLIDRQLPPYLRY